MAAWVVLPFAVPDAELACCAYPQRDPRDYNYPYSHLLYSGVVPDVVGAFVALAELRASFGCAEGCEVEYGKPIALQHTGTEPTLDFAARARNSTDILHTVVMTDPDVPFRDRPTQKERCARGPAAGALGLGSSPDTRALRRRRVLWLVYDIPGNRVDEGKILVEYLGPQVAACPPGDDLCLDEHRITFTLWEQQGPLALDEEDVPIASSDSPARRQRFKTRDFAVRHSLGLPIAVNFFEVARTDHHGSKDEL